MKEPMELSAQESLDRLAGEVFGRLAITTPQGVRIVPLNYTFGDDALVFRTTPYSEVARFAVGTDAAFEIDHIDHSQKTGWSVVVTGALEHVDPSDLEDLMQDRAPESWAGGVRNLYLRLRWREVTGRRLPETVAAPGQDHRAS